MNRDENHSETEAGTAAARPLSALVSRLGDAEADGGGDPRVQAIVTDSSEVRPGALFVALAGTRADGHDFLEEAVARGAVAAVVERDPAEPVGVPLVRVPDTRRALAELAAEWHGRPADRLDLVGITGTIGKTSVLKMLEAALRAADVQVGTIGTMGVTVSEGTEETGYTAPDPLILHEALARMVAIGCTMAAMEVTSHGLDQHRVHGLRYALGIFTNIVPFEHTEYHDSFRGYVEVKRRFLDYLMPGAPLVFTEGDAIVRRLSRREGIIPVGCGMSPGAHVRIDDVTIEATGTRLTLRVQRPLPRLEGAPLDPLDLPLELRLLGRPNVQNAALAATAALCLGAHPDAVRSALGEIPPLPRRMAIAHSEGALIMDDAANHPDAVSALFEVVEKLPVRRAHALFAIRGQRGPKINRRTAEALAIWVGRRPLDTLILTRSADAVDELNRVEEGEARAFQSALRKAGIPFEEIDTLDQAVPSVLERAREGDLVLLLGTQGMDGGFDRARAWLDEHPEWPGSG